jgi:hypothetical protein
MYYVIRKLTLPMVENIDKSRDIKYAEPTTIYTIIVKSCMSWCNVFVTELTLLRIYYMRTNRDGSCEVCGDTQVYLCQTHTFSWYLTIMLSAEIFYVLTMYVPDKGYSRNASWSLNEISTLLLLSAIGDEEPGQL